MTVNDKIKAVVLGHAVGDALGVPVEFCEREELDAEPVTDMEGYGTYPYPAGCWSDDTSMSLAALDSLGKGRIDWDDVMQNFAKWLEEGAYTPTGETFDAGRTCVRAIVNHFAKGTPSTESGGTDEHDNGNGSLMRIHPFALYAYVKEMPTSERMALIHTASALTHGHERSKMACGIYATVLWHLLDAPDKASVRRALEEAADYDRASAEAAHYERLFREDFDRTDRADIASSGYVVDTLEAAIWCLLTTDSYRECVLRAVNLGDDSDTVAAVAGGLAGALYGGDAIPRAWLDTLARREEIEDMCARLGAWRETE